MAFVVTKYGEERLPGRAIPQERRRNGFLGRLDGMTFSEFKHLPLCMQGGLMNMAYFEKAELERMWRYRKELLKKPDHSNVTMKQLLRLYKTTNDIEVVERAMDCMMMIARKRVEEHLEWALEKLGKKEMMTDRMRLALFQIPAANVSAADLKKLAKMGKMQEIPPIIRAGAEFVLELRQVARAEIINKYHELKLK